MNEVKRKASEDSKTTEKYKQMILEALKETGEVKWKELGISPYVKHYHGLNTWAKELVNATDEIIMGMEEICCGQDCGSCDEVFEDYSTPQIFGDNFIITSVDVCAPLNMSVIDTIKAYKAVNNTTLITIPQGFNKKSVEEAIWAYKNYVPAIDADVPLLIQLEEMGFNICLTEKTIHPLLTIKPIFINPKTANPVTGLGPLANKYKSMVIPSPKQVYETRPSAKHELPYVLLSTGTISDSVYSEQWLASKQEAIAEMDHTYGAVLVELDGDIFHTRHLTCKDGKSFVDKGTRYPQMSKVAVKGIIPGDWHSGYTDTSVASVLFDVAEETQAEAVVLNDTCDGHSTNPHNQEQFMTLGEMARMGKLNVTMEVVGVTHDLLEWEKIVEKVYVVRSNHDEFMDRILETRDYPSHPYSSQDLVVVAAAITQETWKTGQKPYALPIAIQKLAYEKKNMPRLQNTTFLERDVSFNIADVDVSHHGDKLINGRPTSIQSVSMALPTSVVAHTHAPGLFRNTYRVGTSSWLDLSYNKGFCSWLHTFALLYEDGSVQLINIIKGRPWANFKPSGRIAQIATNNAHHKWDV